MDTVIQTNERLNSVDATNVSQQNETDDALYGKAQAKKNRSR